MDCGRSSCLRPAAKMGVRRQHAWWQFNDGVLQQLPRWLQHSHRSEPRAALQTRCLCTLAFNDAYTQKHEARSRAVLGLEYGPG